MTNLRTLIAFMSIVLFCISTIEAQTSGAPITYVWDFSDRGGKQNDLTVSLTDEFEEALINSDCCKVLQRRTYSRLFEQKENEKSIAEFNDLSSSSVERLSDLEAETVIFGTIYDDISSGQYKISVSFENFNGTIEKSASVYMAKYDVNNPSKRELSVSELIDELELSSNKNPIQTEVIDEWEFSLVGCESIGKDVKCSITVQSNYRDRIFKLYQYTKAYDEYGYEYSHTNNMQLANKTSNGGIELQLIDGILTRGFVVFKNVSSRAKKFVLLDFNVWGSDLSTKSIQFRDVPIE